MSDAKVDETDEDGHRGLMSDECFVETIMSAGYGGGLPFLSEFHSATEFLGGKSVI